MKNFSFPKSSRLLTNKQFKTVLARRLCVSDGLLKLFIAENDCDQPRLGVSVSKSCGNAVVRNRLKRLIREAFRQNQHQISSGIDYLVIIDSKFAELNESAEIIKKLTFDKIKDSLLTLIANAVAKLR